MFGNKGGDGCTIANGDYGYGAAGAGGGATEVGGNGTKGDEYKGGDGGAGLVSDITGIMMVYGSGGGGSSTWGGAGVGGEGAGDGVYGGNGMSGLANQGGGGGGGSRTFNGGAGGSGIVVLRYVLPGTTPKIDGELVEADKVFEIAKVSKPILYPTEPKVVTNENYEVTVSFGRSNQTSGL